MDSWLHLPDLIFHEAGHFIFSLFGQFMTVLGGSLLQFLIPVIAAVAFLAQDRAGAFRRGRLHLVGRPEPRRPGTLHRRLAMLQLVLLGGKTGAEVEGHDWEFILTQLGILHLDQALGRWTACHRHRHHDRVAGLCGAAGSK